MWWIYALLSAVFAALTAILAKIGLKDINSDLATAIRTIVILIFAWAVAFFRGEVKGVNMISKNGLLFIILSGVATGLSWLFYFKALQLGRVSQVAPVDKLSLALVIIFSVMFLGEPLTWKMLVGSILVIGGIIILIL